MWKTKSLGVTVALLSLCLLSSAFNVTVSGVESTIYIRADGSIDPPSAPILRDGDLYTFTNDVYDAIVIERDNIAVDGAGYTLQGNYEFQVPGIFIGGRSNIVIKDMTITAFYYGINVDSSSDIRIFGISITNFVTGIHIFGSSRLTVSGNRLDGSYDMDGIDLIQTSHSEILGNTIMFTGPALYLSGSDENTIYGNDIEECGQGPGDFYPPVILYDSNFNKLAGNTIDHGKGGEVLHLGYSSHNQIFCNDLSRANQFAVVIGDGCDSNLFYHNNFGTMLFPYPPDSGLIKGPNIWDNGYPSGGNYWGDYIDIDYFNGPNQDLPGSDGIWDHPYIINDINQDNYPLVNPWPVLAIVDIKPKALNLKRSQGVLIAHVELPCVYSVTDIDVSSVMLNGVVQANPRTAVGDYDDDGIMDLKITFQISGLMPWPPFPARFSKIKLTVTGQVSGMPFEGSDTITAISK